MERHQHNRPDANANEAMYNYRGFSRQVELYFRDIKTSMGMEELRCKIPERVEKEFILFAIAHNLLRLLIARAGSNTNFPGKST